jgi:hypothetical protein
LPPIKPKFSYFPGQAPRIKILGHFRFAIEISHPPILFHYRNFYSTIGTLLTMPANLNQE